jgi:ferredoxin
MAAEPGREDASFHLLLIMSRTLPEVGRATCIGCGLCVEIAPRPFHTDRKRLALAFSTIPALLCLFLLLSGADAHAASTRERSVFAYGGKWSDNLWNEIIRGETELRSSYVWVAGASQKIRDLGENLGVEGEVNVAVHSGRQSHFELSTAAILRWHAFPWRRYVATSLGYGLGLSWALDRPPIEEQPERRASRTLIFMPTELTFGPPGAAWEVMLRIHHRSGAFGVFKDAGGSNFIALGLRFR